MSCLVKQKLLTLIKMGVKHLLLLGGHFRQMGMVWFRQTLFFDLFWWKCLFLFFSSFFQFIFCTCWDYFSLLFCVPISREELIFKFLSSLTFLPFFVDSKLIFGSSKYLVKIGVATHTRCLSPCMGLHFFLKTSQTDEVTRKGLKFVFEVGMLVLGPDEITRRWGNFVTPKEQKKMGPRYWQSLKRPCQHLGPEFRQLSIWKKIYVCLRFFWKNVKKKSKSVRDLTKLPDLAVSIGFGFGSGSRSGSDLTWYNIPLIMWPITFYNPKSINTFT